MSVHHLYTALLTLLLPLMVIRLLIRSLRNRDYRLRMGERFGDYRLELEGAIWIHAVSVGEVAAAIPLLQRLRQRHPDRPLLVTTTTPTGARQLASYGIDGLHHRYLPFDLPPLMRRVLQSVRPALLVVMETELWPNLFRLCAHQSVPVVVANARLSARSAAGYRRFPRLTSQLMEQITLVAAQSESDRQRFLSLGCGEEQVVVTGSIKFDLRIPADVSEQAAALIRMLGPDRRRWIAASTHDNEEAQLLGALAPIRQRHPDALLILVPRHPERADAIEALYRAAGLQVARRSSDEPCDPSTDIYLVDTIGELLPFYAAAEVALIGGTLVDHGGHNPIEPAALAIPLILGPSITNFIPVVELLKESTGVVLIESVDQLPAALDHYLTNQPLRMRAGEELKALVAGERGAADRMEAAISPLITKQDGKYSVAPRRGQCSATSRRDG